MASKGRRGVFGLFAADGSGGFSLVGSAVSGALNGVCSDAG